MKQEEIKVLFALLKNETRFYKKESRKKLKSVLLLIRTMK